MFDIRFVGDNELEHFSRRTSVRPEHGKHIEAIGQITLGEFSERFESPLGFWLKEDYQHSWRDALSRLVGGAEKTALFTAMHDPAFANYLTWWPLYREFDIVFVHNQLLFLNQLAEPFQIESFDKFVTPRATINEDGNKISEWSVPLSDVERYLSRVAAT